MDRDKLKAQKGWMIAAVLGLVWIVIEFSIPDAVPEKIFEVISNPSSARYFGVIPFLYVTLFIYQVGGLVLFVGGIWRTVSGYCRS